MRDMFGPSEDSNRTYLDFKLVIDLHDSSKDGDVLHKTGKLPAIPNALEKPKFLRRLFLSGSDRLRAAALSRYHCGGMRPSRPGVNRGGFRKGVGSLWTDHDPSGCNVSILKVEIWNDSQCGDGRDIVFFFPGVGGDGKSRRRVVTAVHGHVSGSPVVSGIDIRVTIHSENQKRVYRE